MQLGEIKANLCIYDRRNPDYFMDDDDTTLPRNGCMCDNCFYRRDVLAVELLKLQPAPGNPASANKIGD
jgi:hypothetical protein